jgi:hypothetical protein
VKPDDAALKDARDLLEAAARFVELTAARGGLEERVILLARRLTRDWRLTDDEAIRSGGELALRMLEEAGRGG